MQANNIDNDLEHDSDTQEGDVPRLGNAAVHELNQIRAEALRDIDKGGFSWFHLKLCFVAGTGFFRDAYDIFAINLASIMLGYIYGHTPGPGLPRQLSRNQDFGIKVAAPVGNLFGQLLFGWLDYIVGRKPMHGIELVIILTSAFAQALAGSSPGVNLIGVLIVWRFIMGVGMGAGGDCPLSAVIASEFASTGSRGRLVSTVFTAQGWGNLAASLVALITVHAYRDSILTDNLNDLKYIDYCWRILIGLGCVPDTIALYFRLTIPETPRFTMDIDRDIQKARTDIENVLGPNGGPAAVHWVDPDAVIQPGDAPHRSRSDFMNFFAQPGNLLPLFGVACSWFAIDAAFHGLGLNSSSILTSPLLTRARIGSHVTVTPSDLITLGIYESSYNIVIGSLIVCVAGLLPGYYASFSLNDVWGRRPIQFLGFAMLTVLLAMLAGICPGTQSTGL
jgi:PHS family inorganic phosphate transporter-like MFS transporter